MRDLEPAERAGVVAVGPARATFSHPLVRAAVYQAADAPARRAAHRAHAASAAALGESALDRRAWHLALAATGPDEIAASELDAAAGAGDRTQRPRGGVRGLRDGGAAHAGRAPPRAAAPSGRLERARRRRRRARRAALRRGHRPRGDPSQALEGVAGRGFVETFSGSARRAVEMLVAAADRVAPVAPHAAAGLLVQAMLPASMRSDLRRGAGLADRAAALAEGAPLEVRAVADVASAVVHTFSGDPRDPSSESVALLAASPDPMAFMMVLAQPQCWMLMERYAEAEARLDALVNVARQRSTPSILPLPLYTRGEVRRRLGRLAEAAADASEALALSEDTGQSSNAGLSRWLLALIDAVHGRSADCRTQVAAMLSLKGPSEAEALRNYSDQALGFALGAGDLDEAVHHLMAVNRLHRETGGAHPLIDCYEQDLVEALLRLGRVEEAGGALAATGARVELTATPWPMAAAARLRGLAQTTPSRTILPMRWRGTLRRPLPSSGRAPSCAWGTPTSGAARAEGPGAAGGGAADVRGPRRQAVAEKAAASLRAAGARPRRPSPSSSEALTPQELQVALTVAGGATNKEAATALLISPKTVEYHLGKVYEKLGVRSRAERPANGARGSLVLRDTDAGLGKHPIPPGAEPLDIRRYTQGDLRRWRGVGSGRCASGGARGRPRGVGNELRGCTAPHASAISSG